jgi:hypothetical protein
MTPEQRQQRAERQQLYRERRKNEGKVLVRVWVPAAAVAAVRAAIAAVLGKDEGEK